MIEKSILFTSTHPLDPNASNMASPSANLPSKTTKRWNQLVLGYFDPYVNTIYSKGKIVLIGKDVNYKNMVLFIQYFQSLISFKRAAFVKANIATSLWDPTLEWYISKLSNFDHNTLNNDLSVKNWINTLFHYFKMPTSIVFNLLSNKTYSFNDA